MRYKIKKIVLTSGERLPILICKSGNPVFEAVIFSLVEMRARNFASNTIDKCLRAIIILYEYLDVHGLELNSLISNGNILAFPVIDGLVRFCKMHVFEFTNDCSSIAAHSKPARVVELEKVRKKAEKDSARLVTSSFAATRVLYIKRYIISVMTAMAYKEDCKSPERQRIMDLRDKFSYAIDSRTPKIDRRGILDEREGLSPEDSHEFLRVISPQSNDNPWNSEYVKVRNELILLWLHHLGMRRGELLNIKTTDVLFQERMVIIERSADDPKDPRLNQPLSKTKARKLPISEELLQKTEVYISMWRSQSKFARKHLFLFTSVDGFPLSLSSFTKLFITLRKKCPQLPCDLFAHNLRHTWNTDFSEKAEKYNMSGEIESKTRSYLMGWSENSGTAATYNKRHIKKKANEISLRMQSKITTKE